MPTLKQLRYLVALAEHLHFRRAAETCCVSQPTLSGQIKELEDRLGLKLVNRDGGKVSLTPMGKEISRHAENVLDSVHGIVDLAKKQKNRLDETICFGAPPTLGPYILPYILSKFQETSTTLKLQVSELYPEMLLQNLHDGHLDLALHPLPVKNTRIECVGLFREPLLMATSPHHAISKANHAVHQDLKGEKVLLLDNDPYLYDPIRDLCAKTDAVLSLEYKDTSLDTLRHMVGMNMGVSFFPAMYVRSEIHNDDRVIVRSFDSKPLYRSIGLAWRRRSKRRNKYLSIAESIRLTLKERVPEVTVLH
jgi:LysR family hydrogen peroxide-inducible transcriptional activator